MGEIIIGCYTEVIMKTWEQLTTVMNEENNGANYGSEAYWGTLPEEMSVENHLIRNIKWAKEGHCYDGTFVRLAGGKRLAQCLSGVNRSIIDLHTICVQIGRKEQGFNALEITI